MSGNLPGVCRAVDWLELLDGVDLLQPVLNGSQVMTSPKGDYDSCVRSIKRTHTS